MRDSISGIIGLVIFGLIVWALISYNSRLSKLEKVSHVKGEMELTINLADGTNNIGDIKIK